MPEVIMPKLSDTMTEGKLVRWIKQEGETISMGDVLAEVETDKATMEMEAFDDGVLTIYASEGESIPVGTSIAFIAGEGETAPKNPQSTSAPEEEADSKESTTRSEESVSQESPAQESASPAPATEVTASPLAKKIAQEKGVDLTQIKGSGPGGRIIKRDLEKASDLSTTSSSSDSSDSAPQPSQGEAKETIPLTSMRQTIARRLLESKTSIPHFYLRREVHVGTLLDMQRQINESDAKEGNRYTVNDFILKAAVMATRAVPAVNASFAEDSVIQYASVGLSVAIAVEDGLVTPVISQAEKKSLLEISQAVKELAQRAREHKLKPHEFDGGTLTVSSLGSYGVDHFDAIINPPQAIILSVGTVQKKPVVSEAGEIVVGECLCLGLSCDHRVVDGAVGATYLAEVCKLIENPALMLV